MAGSAASDAGLDLEKRSALLGTTLHLGFSIAFVALLFAPDDASDRVFGALVVALLFDIAIAGPLGIATIAVATRRSRRVLVRSVIIGWVVGIGYVVGAVALTYPVLAALPTHCGSNGILGC